MGVHTKTIIRCLFASRKGVFVIFPLGAPYTVLNDVFRKDDIIFRKQFNRNFISIIHRFRVHDAFLQNEIDVMVISRLGALYAVCDDGFWKADFGFLVGFHSKYSSIIHRFQDNDVLLHTENDVINITPLEDAVYSSQRQHSRGWLWLPISVVTLLLSCTASEIMTFSCKPEIMSWCYIR